MQTAVLNYKSDWGLLSKNKKFNSPDDGKCKPLLRIASNSVYLSKIAEKYKKQKGTYVHLKSNNLQYNTLGRWVDRLIDHASDGPSIILID